MDGLKPPNLLQLNERLNDGVSNTHFNNLEYQVTIQNTKPRRFKPLTAASYLGFPRNTPATFKLLCPSKDQSSILLKQMRQDDVAIAAWREGNL